MLKLGWQDVPLATNESPAVQLNISVGRLPSLTSLLVIKKHQRARRLHLFSLFFWTVQISPMKFNCFLSHGHRRKWAKWKYWSNIHNWQVKIHWKGSSALHVHLLLGNTWFPLHGLVLQFNRLSRLHQGSCYTIQTIGAEHSGESRVSKVQLWFESRWLGLNYWNPDGFEWQPKLKNKMIWNLRIKICSLSLIFILFYSLTWVSKQNSFI